LTRCEWVAFEWATVARQGLQSRDSDFMMGLLWVVSRRAGRSQAAWQADSADLGVAAVAGGVSGRVRGQAARVQLADVGIPFVAEKYVPAADVPVLVRGMRGMPVVAGELVVRARQEVVALGIVLADEEDEGRLGSLSEVGVAPPPGEVAVVAAELVVVLVCAAGAVVLDKEEPRMLGCVVGDFECGVGDDRAWLRVA
jgi:hypothetical protein